MSDDDLRTLCQNNKLHSQNLTEPLLTIADFQE